MLNEDLQQEDCSGVENQRTNFFKTTQEVQISLGFLKYAAIKFNTHGAIFMINFRLKPEVSGA